MRCSLVFSLLLLLIAQSPKSCPGQDLSAKSEPELRPIWQDAFTQDSRNEYGLEGKVDWQAGKLVLTGGSTVQRKCEGGPAIEIELDLVADKLADNDKQELRVWLNFEEASPCYVRITRAGDAPSLALAVVATERDRDRVNESVIREAVTTEFRGKLVIRYQHGLISLMAAPSATPWLIAFVETDPENVTRIKLDNRESPSILARVKLVSCAPLKRLNETEMQELNQSRTDNDNMHLLFQADNYAAAIELAEKIHKVRQRILDPDHPYCLQSLNNLAYVVEKMGRLEKAEALFLEVKERRARVLGRMHPDYATCLNNLSFIYVDKQDFAQAEALLLECREIRAKTLGKQHALYATSINNLGRLYFSMDDYARAEPLFFESKEVRKLALGEMSPAYATSLRNLAVLYREIGDFAQAEPLMLQSLAITEKTKGKENITYANELATLARLYRVMLDLERSEQLFAEALAITERAVGKEDVAYAQCQIGFATMLLDKKEFKRAEPMLIEALGIIEKVRGKSHPQYGSCLNNLAELYYLSSDFDRALELLVQSKEMVKGFWTDQHPRYATAANNLALVYAAADRADEAIPLMEETLRITQKHLADTAVALSERQQLSMNREARLYLDNYLGTCFECASIPEHAVENVLSWKGSVIHRQRQMRKAASDPAISKQFAKLQKIAQDLSSLTQMSPPAGKVDLWKAAIAKTTSEKEQLEIQLNQQSAALRDSLGEVTLEQIQQAIPEDAVLIDYLEYERHNGRFLLASIVKRGAKPVMISVGRAREASEAIDEWRATFGASPASHNAGLKLRRQIWEPLLTHIGDARTVLVSTDGVLGQLPLGALPGKKADTYLIEDHRLALVPVPQLLPSLVRSAAPEPNKYELLLIGDVDYDAQTQPVAATQPGRSARKRPWERGDGADAGDTRWPMLHETRDEVEFIGGLYKRIYTPTQDAVVDLRKAAATENAFRRYAPESTILHLSTHGFFAAANPAKDKAKASSNGESNRAGLLRSDREAVADLNPGQLAGLVFAGANLPPASERLSDLDDGIMTADEIAFLPLEKVRLAVLSACETGLGEVAGGEGLLGIQRGFQVAGTRSTVASLWKVNDAATRRLMQEFYTNYLEKEMSMLDSLREAQLWALNHPNDVPRAAPVSLPDAKVVDQPPNASAAARLAPQYWAAFVLSGDWR